LTHRHPSDHGCVTLPQNTNPHLSKETKPSRSFIAKKTNPKIELMRLKLNAKGEPHISPLNRYYCNLYLPVNENFDSLPQLKPLSRYFDLNMVVGKLLDMLAAEAKIRHYNSLNTDLRIGLRGVYHLPLNSTIASCVQRGELVQGGNLILEKL
jgi:hypothetical protein